jgi:hypothetical protein
MNSFTKKPKGKHYRTKQRGIDYTSLKSGYLKHSKEIDYYKASNVVPISKSKNYGGSKNSLKSCIGIPSTDESSMNPKSEVEELTQYKSVDCNQEIIQSLEILNKRSTHTRNSPGWGLLTDSDFQGESRPQSFYHSLKWANDKIVSFNDKVTRKDIIELWTVIEHQGGVIKTLIEENQRITKRLLEAEEKLKAKIKNVKKNVSGLSVNVESLIPIIQEINNKYKSIKGSHINSRSPVRKPQTSFKSLKRKKSLKPILSKMSSKVLKNEQIPWVIPDSEQVSVVNYNLHESDAKSNPIVNPPSQDRQRPVYFKSTLSSHWKIQKLSLLKKKWKTEWASVMQTPGPKEKFEVNSNQEIEQELPQMSKLFSSAKGKGELKSNVKQWRLDLTDGQKLKAKALFKESEDPFGKRFSVAKSVVLNVYQEGRSNTGHSTSRNHDGRELPTEERQRTVSKTRKSWFD